MLKSELNRLEKYIGEHEAAAVKEECARLKVIWVRELFRPVKEEALTRYVRFHQAGLIMLSDRNDSWPEVQQELEALIAFFRESFYPYFDAGHPASAYFLHGIRQEMNEFLLQVETKSKPVYVDKPLVDCIYASVKAIAGEDNLSYERAGQLRHFIALFREHLQIYSSTTTSELANRLYAANFNSAFFVEWLKQVMRKQMAAIAGPAKVDRWIDDKMAELESLRPDKLQPFDAENLAVDDWLLNWLQAQKTTAVSIHQMGLNFSVAQFAMFVRVLQVTGCFRENNLAQIQRFFSAHFTTKKQAHISLKSFGRAFYTADQATAAVVRDILKKMIGYIDQHYFPK